MASLKNFLYMTLKWALRDKIFHAVLGVAVVLFLLVPTFSLFSMRQVQELAITLSLTAVSVVLLLLSVLLGAFSVWRDIEKRYVTSVLGLPLSRASYLLGKFSGIVLILASCSLFLGCISFLVIKIAAAQYPSEISIQWLNIAVAMLFSTLKYILLVAVAMLLSSFSTSFFLPIVGTISVYLAGSASQDVLEYISGDYGRTISPLFKMMIKIVYYLLPNFAAFNLNVQAIYGLPLAAISLGYTCLYFILYTSIVLYLTVWIFSRRDLA